jgi:hypothetical protein
MKSLFLRSGVALACALTLASCGGSGGSLIVGGIVVNLNRTGLVLLNNGGDELAVASGSTSFVFPTLVGNDSNYNVTVKSSPSNAVCTASSNTGKTSTYDITSVVISCVTNTYDLGGTVSNLKNAGLVLINGPDKVSVAADATTFKMTKVGDGTPYGVTVLTQPANQTCTVTNGTNTMGPANVTNVQVNCI